MSMLIQNRDTSKIFLRYNNFETATYTNSGESDVVLPKGTLLGRITTSGLVIPLVAAATDGSAEPLGILADDYEVAEGASVTVTYCYAGHVAEELIKLNGSETLNTVITGKGRIRDLITRNTHISLIDATELTGYDNHQ